MTAAHTLPPFAPGTDTTWLRLRIGLLRSALTHCRKYGRGTLTPGGFAAQVAHMQAEILTLEAELAGAPQLPGIMEEVPANV